MKRVGTIVALLGLIAQMLQECSAQRHIVRSENQETDQSDPWINPLEELRQVSPLCSMKISTFPTISALVQAQWQACISSLQIKANESAEDSESRGEAQTMAICRNTTAYKNCWIPLLTALDICEEGSGNVTGDLYFALYDDICREEGRITLENRKMAFAEGELCERDYSTEECKENRQFRQTNDLCLRFQSNVACDISSISPQCSNSIDKGSHADIFERVGKVLQCRTNIPNPASSGVCSRNTFRSAYAMIFLAAMLYVTSDF